MYGNSIIFSQSPWEVEGVYTYTVDDWLFVKLHGYFLQIPAIEQTN